MYMKVAASIVTLFILSGCVSQTQLNAPQKGVNVGVEVEESSTTIIPLDKNATIHESKRKKRPSYLKPEPFSLESNENDPELLGPQTTLSTPLTREEKEDNSTKRM